MSEEVPQEVRGERIEVRYGGLYYDIKRSLKYIALGILALIVAGVSFALKLDLLGWFILAFIITAPIAAIVWLKVLKVPYTTILEVDVSKRLIHPYVVPVGHLGRRIELKKGANIAFMDKNGFNVVVADKVEFEKDRVIVETAETHTLTDFQFIKNAKAWKWLKGELHRALDRIAVLERAASIKAKKYAVDLVTKPLDEAMKILEEAAEVEEEKS